MGYKKIDDIFIDFKSYLKKNLKDKLTKEYINNILIETCNNNSFDELDTYFQSEYNYYNLFVSFVKDSDKVIPHCLYAQIDVKKMIQHAFLTIDN